MWALRPQITPNIKIHPHARAELTKFLAFIHGNSLAKGFYRRFYSGLCGESWNLEANERQEDLLTVLALTPSPP